MQCTVDNAIVVKVCYTQSSMLLSSKTECVNEGLWATASAMSAIPLHLIPFDWRDSMAVFLHPLATVEKMDTLCPRLQFARHTNSSRLCSFIASDKDEAAFE